MPRRPAPGAKRPSRLSAGPWSPSSAAGIARPDAEAAFDRTRLRQRLLRLSAEADSARSRVATLEEQLASVMPECDAAAAALNQAQAAHRAQIDPAALHRAASEARARVGARACCGRGRTPRDGRTAAHRVGPAGPHGRDRPRARGPPPPRRRPARPGRNSTFARARHGVGPRTGAAWLKRRTWIARAATSGARGQLARGRGGERPAAAAARGSGRTGGRDGGRRRGPRQPREPCYALREALVRAEGPCWSRRPGHAASELARIAERESALPSVPPPAEATQAAEDRARTRLHRLLRERGRDRPGEPAGASIMKPLRSRPTWR